jgi:hypothetical protein
VLLPNKPSSMLSSSVLRPNRGAFARPSLTSMEGLRSEGMAASCSSQSSNSSSELAGLSGSLSAETALPFAFRCCRDEERVRGSCRELDPDATTGEVLLFGGSRLKSSERVWTRVRGCGGGFFLSGMDSGIRRRMQASDSTEWQVGGTAASV